MRHARIGARSIGTLAAVAVLVSLFPAPAFATTCANDGTLTFTVVGSQCRAYITTTGSGTVTLPSDWSNTNTIETLGAGGNGSNRTSAGGGTGGSGGGGGAYAAVSNTSTLSAGGTYGYTVGAVNTATSLGVTVGTWFCKAQTGCTSVTDTSTIVGSESGTTAINSSTAGSGGNTGGQSTLGTNLLFSGGSGKSGTSAQGGGGGGAAGATGAGATATSGTGGTGDGGTTAAGVNGTEWDSTHGSGGGGTGAVTGNGNTGGRYGAGGGGAGTATGNTGGAGFQGIIVITYTPTVPDTTPPSPSTSSFSSSPAGASASSISMTATTETDTGSPPVQYYFGYAACTSNNGTGGTDSGWQSSASYTNSGLQVNKCYGYLTQARDSATTKNYTATSTQSNAYTLANTPGAPTLSSPTPTTLRLSNAENGNPSSSPTTLFAVQVSATSPTDATWNGKYIDSSGNPSSVAVWLSDAQLDGLVITGLSPSTTYTVQSKARNGDSVETSFSSTGSNTTDVRNGPFAPRIVRLVGGIRLRGGVRIL